MSAPASSFCAMTWRGQTVQIEYRWLSPQRADEPLMVFLHEGLGSVSMWRDFPGRLCDALGWRGLVYSRPGYGRSTPRASGEPWAPDFMHQQALEVLPALLDTLGIDTHQRPPWLLGHSDGGSIALIYAARHPERLSGAIVLAPHIFVEDIALRSIEQARVAFEQGDLPICASDWPATTTTRNLPFMGGTPPGCRPPSATGTWPLNCPISAAPCSPCRGQKTNTARWRKSEASRTLRRKPSCWNCPPAATRLNAISPRR